MGSICKFKRAFYKVYFSERKKVVTAKSSWQDSSIGYTWQKSSCPRKSGEKSKDDEFG